MQIGFKIGDELKFSLDGINLWCGGRRGFFDDQRYKLWRWRVIGFKEHYFMNGDSALVLKRLDRKYTLKQYWHPKYFSKV